MTRVVMHGCNGHMGRVITDLCKEDNDIEIVAGVDKFHGVDNDYPVFDSINDVDVDFDAIIDFSHISTIDGLLDYCENNNKPVVLCTTGLTDDMLSHVDSASQKVAVLRSANMSLGINTLFDLCKKVTQVFADAGFSHFLPDRQHSVLFRVKVPSFPYCFDSLFVEASFHAQPVFQLTDTVHIVQPGQFFSLSCKRFGVLL